MSLDWQTFSDGELAALTLSGRQDAFTEIMRRHREAIYRLVRGYVFDAHEAVDLTQDSFAAAFENLARYDGVRSFRAWLARIAINKCRDWNRRARVRRILSFGSAQSDRQITSAADNAPNTDTAVSDRRELEQVSLAITALPRNLRETLLLRTIEGLSQAETADSLGISEKAVETRLYRARAKLSEIFDRS